MDFSKRHMLVNAFFLSHFSHCSLVWTCISHIRNNKINRLRGKRQQLICKDKQSSFHEVLEEKVVSQYMNETYVSLQ